MAIMIKAALLRWFILFSFSRHPRDGRPAPVHADPSGPGYTAARVSGQPTVGPFRLLVCLKPDRDIAVEAVGQIRHIGNLLQGIGKGNIAQVDRD